jgi:hypothetical protein
MAGNVIPFRQREPIGPPFNPANPDHVSAWRAMYLFGLAELERQGKRT